jgi:hypothetical protein
MGNINELHMQQLFIRRDARSVLPAVGAAAKAPPGHVFIDQVDGTWFINEGTLDKALYTNPLVNRYDLVEKFQKRPALNAVIALDENSNAAAHAAAQIANKDFEVLGTNMTTALVTFADGGGITLTTAGADDDQGILLAHLDTNQTSWASTKWNTADECIFETVIETGASIASYQIWAGLKLTNTGTIATDNDQCFFTFNVENTTSATQFVCVTSRSGTDTETASGVTVAAATSYHLKIVIDSARVPRFYINGVLAVTAAALTDDVDLKPYIGVQALTGAAKAVIVRGLRCSKTLND